MKELKYIGAALFLCILGVWFNSCSNEESYTPFYDYDEMQISEYIANREELSELAELLEYTGLKSRMSFYGTYTFFAPTNEALKNFYTEMGKSSYKDFDKDELLKIVSNHIISQPMLTTRTGEGSLPDTTLAGSSIIVTIEGQGSDLKYVLNKEASIVERDIELPNGVVQVVDGVIRVIDFSVSGWVKNNRDEFSIFAEALEKTEVDNVLNSNIAFVKNGETFRNYYTLWAVPDEAYREAGINSFEQLAAIYNTNGQPYNSPTSSLFQYMEYHCINRLLSLSEFDREPTQVVTINNRLFQIEIDKADQLHKINKEENGNYVAVNLAKSNNNASNGFVHILKTPLSEVRFKPVKRVVSLTHHPDIPWQQMITDGFAGRRYNWPSLNNDKDPIPVGALSGIRFHSEAVCYIDNHLIPSAAKEKELLFMVLPNDNNMIWYEFDLPPITSGRYDVGVMVKGGTSNRAVVQCMFNGEPFGDILDMREGISGVYTKSIGIIDIKTTEDNVIRFKELKSGYHLIVQIVFTPVE